MKNKAVKNMVVFKNFKLCLNIRTNGDKIPVRMRVKISVA